MEYQLTAAVWELTMMCNMRCQHCGSSCDYAMEDELNTQEALMLCDDLKELGLKYLTLSGGELTTRKDWPLIAKRCTANGIVTSIITNGWNMNEEMLASAKEAGIDTIAISIDGCKETHDRIRRSGSYERNMKNFQLIVNYNIIPAAITTVQKQNIDELEELYQNLKRAGVQTWQIQIALPMGNFKEHMEECLEPKDVQTIIDFAYSKINEDMTIDLADCIGYYTKKDIALKKKRFGENTLWTGCSAGKYSIGILNNGNIVGCTSIRSSDFVEGNIRERKLSDIWNDDKSFAWNRNFTRENLLGNCRECCYGEYCLGGCSNLRYCMYGDLNTDNKYCAYSFQIDEYRKKIDSMFDYDELIKLLEYTADKKQLQIGNMLIKRIKDLGFLTEKLYEIEAFLKFFAKDYWACKNINEIVLKKNPHNKIALKGLGLALYKIGKIDEGISIMYKALDKKYPDGYSDLYMVLMEQNRVEEAEKVKIMQNGA